jgi:hypothetical protein
MAIGKSVDKSVSLSVQRNRPGYEKKKVGNMIGPEIIVDERLWYRLFLPQNLFSTLM